MSTVISEDMLMSYLRSRGYNTELGRHLYHDVKRTKLIDVQVEGFVAMQQGGTPSARFWRFTLEQVQDGVLAAGLLTRTELAEYLALMESSEYRWLSPLMLGVWGRKS